MDDSNLSAAAECFYKAKNPMSQRRFYSQAKLAEESAEETAKIDLSQSVVFDVRISKEETVAGLQFAAVSRTKRATSVPDGSTACSYTATRTWVRENGKWKFLGGYASVEELTQRKFQDGDFTGAAAAAEQWLKVDPLSIDAYKQLGFAVYRGAPGKPVGRAAPLAFPSSALALGMLPKLGADYELPRRRQEDAPGLRLEARFIDGSSSAAVG